MTVEELRKMLIDATSGRDSFYNIDQLVVVLKRDLFSKIDFFDKVQIRQLIDRVVDNRRVFIDGDKLRIMGAMHENCKCV